METKFTPAPWKVVQNTAGSWGVNCMGSCDDNEGEIGIYSPTLASMWDVTHGKHENKDPQANAHLIAAAPEMYSALEEASDLLYQCADEDSINFSATIRELLTKARGE